MPAQEDIDYWDGTKDYKLGDLVYAEILEYIPPDFFKNKYTFIKKKIVTTPQNPNLGYVSYAQYPPSHPEYYEKTKDNEWELIWPEWDVGGRYGEYSLVTYKGNYYIGTNRLIRNISAYEGDAPERKLPSIPPDVAVDEHGIRVWSIFAGAFSIRTYSLCPYILTRTGNSDFSDSQKREYDAYRWNPLISPVPISHRFGVRIPERSMGYSLEVYRAFKSGDGPNAIDEPETPEDECGAGLQTLQIGSISHNIQIFSVGKMDAGGYIVNVNPWASRGNRTASPDYNGWADENGAPAVDPETGEPIFDDTWDPEENDCSELRRGTPKNKDGLPAFMARGHIFYQHNHPLYLHRSVSVYHTIATTSQYWKYHPQTEKWVSRGPPPEYRYFPVPCFWYWGSYSLQNTTDEPIKGSRSGTFSPKDDCWCITSPQVDDVTPINSIGIFTLPGPQDMSASYPTINSFPSKNRLSPEVKVDKDD
jgi:hypothetical protein